MKFFRQREKFACVLLAGTLISGTVLVNAETVKYAGSDFLEGTVEKTLKENVSKGTNALTLEGELIGSKSAIRQLRAGECDFALIMWKGDPKSDFPEVADGKWRAIPIAHQVTYIAVPKSNKISDISFYELRGIFARYAEEHVVNWGDGAKIHPIIGSRTDSASASFFQAIVFPKSPFTQVRSTTNDDAALQEASSSHEAIAVVSTPISSKYPTLKTLAISDSQQPDNKKTAYLPTPANIYNHDYPLSVPFYVVYPTENRAKILPVLRTIFSKEFADTIQAQNLMPLPENIRENVKKSVDALGK